MKAGAFDFVEKPFQGQILLKRIREALVQDAEERCRQAQRADAVARMALLWAIAFRSSSLPVMAMCRWRFAP
jgi:FixJ family two-component response regulator